MSSKSPQQRKLAIFNSRPVDTYDTLATALMSIVSNKLDIDSDAILLYAEDEVTKEFVEQVAKEYKLTALTVTNRKDVLKEMTDVLFFCSATDPTLFTELAPYREKGIVMYFVVQE